ncbi:MAG: von Willebrand factor type A domain-containing protein [Planctomycetes bacterium]|nr:von Willebrand factor type A domain-containing protein [Planctomycetota bacterium]
MNEHDPIIEAALEEVLGGKSPPDLIAQTLAKAGAEALPPKQPLARPRPAWRAWGTGLAAAAAVAIVVGLVTVTGSQLTLSKVPEDRVAEKSAEDPLADVAMGSEDSAGGIYFTTPASESKSGPRKHDRPIGGVFTKLPPADTTLPTEIPSVGPRDPNFKANGSNPFVDTEDDQLSTFALEHDTGSYAVARGYLDNGALPPEAAVRAEEFINYFGYGYVAPTSDPFAITMDAAPSRYGQDLANCYLLRIGVQARQIPEADRKPAVLTFVIDVSGSMDSVERLPLVKAGLKLLVEQLREGDKVGIAVFGARGYQYMDYKDAWQKDEILAAIDKLKTEGSTNAEEGLKIGYSMASSAFREGWTNRVVLCSDGVANVGRTRVEGILQTIVENRRKGITLSTVGFGMGDYNDNLMEQLGDKGDGHYAYVDSIDEARRIFADNLTGALEVVGRDVKIQVEFNPLVVKSYRLIGYVNRDIKDEDFRNDAVDGGEISAGHSATALYEIKLYENGFGAMANATIRYKEDERDEPKEISQEVFTQQIAGTWETADKGLRLAGDVAEFAELLAKGFYAKQGSFSGVLEDLKLIQQDFRDDKVDELIELVEKANKLK